MKSNRIAAIALLTVLGGGCATQTSESTHGSVMTANCAHPTAGATYRWMR